MELFANILYLLTPTPVTTTNFNVPVTDHINCDTKTQAVKHKMNQDKIVCIYPYFGGRDWFIKNMQQHSFVNLQKQT